MSIQSALNTTLPGNLRYQPEGLIPYFGYDYLYRTVGEVEIATLQVFSDIGIIPKEQIELLTPELIQAILAIPTTAIDAIERKITHHDVRAWVKEAQRIINSRLGGWVHVPHTSYDPLDTGRILQFVRAYREAIKPAAKEILIIFRGLVVKFADQIQIGRTHGQHALPITVGFWLATILNRIMYNLEEMDLNSYKLVGKISGAVGAYNAQIGLGIEARCGEKTFEQRVLEKLGLQPARISTQILPPEPLAYFLYSCQMLSAAFAQFGRDGRNLMRSEIAEVSEAFEQGQVGSSTMGHKRNPIHFEKLEGMWIKNKNEFGKVQDTLISEHQRDLTASAVARDFPIILVNLLEQMNTLLQKNKEGVPFLSRITVDAEACERNLAQSAHLILAEPLYIALQMAGYEGDAYELVNTTLVPLAQKEHRLLVDIAEKVAEKDAELTKAFGNIPQEVRELLREPRRYTGRAKEKALEIAELAQKQINRLQADTALSTQPQR